MTRNWSNLIVPSHSDNQDDAAAIASKAAEMILAHKVASSPACWTDALPAPSETARWEWNRVLNNDEQVFVVNSKNGKRRTRWSFSFGGGDDDESFAPVVDDDLASIAPPSSPCPARWNCS